MQEVAIALESYRQKKPCAKLHPWLGCESLDRQLFSFEREHNVPFRSKRAQSFSDGENSGPNPSLHTAPLHSQTRNQARQRSENQGQAADAPCANAPAQGVYLDAIRQAKLTLGERWRAGLSGLPLRG